MKKTYLFPLLTSILIGFTSCQQEKQKTEIKQTIQKVEKPQKNILVENVSVEDSEIGIGCITHYYRKGSNERDLIFVQAGSTKDDGWNNFVKIDGKRVVFYKKDEATKYESEDEFSMHLENAEYEINIKAKIGEINKNADSAGANGQMKVLDKKTKAETTIEFEGGSAC